MHYSIFLSQWGFIKTQATWKSALFLRSFRLRASVRSQMFEVASTCSLSLVLSFPNNQTTGDSWVIVVLLTFVARYRGWETDNKKEERDQGDAGLMSEKNKNRSGAQVKTEEADC